MEDDSMTEVEEQQEDFLPGFPTVTAFSNDGIKKIVGATKAFQSLPAAGPAWDLQKSYPAFNKAMRTARATLVPMMTSLLRHANISPDEFRSGDIDEKFDFLVESNDDMLERIGRALDEASGLFKKAETIVVNQSSSVKLKPPGVWAERKLISEQQDSGPKEPLQGLSSTATITNDQVRRIQRQHRVREKPQIYFKVPVDNSVGAFIPKLKEKPHSIKPLSILPEYNNNNEEYFGHPYLVELTRFEPSEAMLAQVEPQVPKKVEETPLIEVSTGRDFSCMLKDLMKAKEIAVDLEHHSYRSFLGLTCLMQISTRDKDYVVDGFTLREDLYLLNDIFADPKIVKVFHGAAYDIEWLQKDFGLYVVNMFDTQVAAKALGIQYLGLQYLLQTYCGISQNKTFQLADWRIRPIPQEMLHYARQDTHFLLYIYDKLKNQLLETGSDSQLKSVYELSKAVCLKRYEKPSNNPNLAIRKMRRTLNNRQVYAFTELYKWRDALARERDESLAFILPNHMLLSIAEQLPKEMSGILACCEPVPPSVHAHLGKIRRIVTTARELPLQERVKEEKAEKRPKLKDWVIVMNSVHDVTLSEVSKGSSEKSKVSRSDPAMEVEEAAANDANEEADSQSEALDIVWPKPINGPKDTSNRIKVLAKPSMFFNHKVNLKKPAKIETADIQNEDYTSKFRAAAAPFDRYQLSNEILELLKDPKKKEALDMENPIVRAVYETVFLDPTEDDLVDKDDKPQVLEKVFTEGEFIPFNPLADGPKPSKKRKRNEKLNPWDDSKREKLDPDVVDPPVGVEDVKIEANDTTKQEVRVEDEDIEEGEIESPSKLGDFFSVSSDQPDSKSRKGKKNKKKNNLLEKLKNTFGKKKKANTGSTSTADVHNLHSEGQGESSAAAVNNSSERRQSPRKHAVDDNIVPNPNFNPALARTPSKRQNQRNTQSTPDLHNSRSRNSTPSRGGAQTSANRRGGAQTPTNRRGGAQTPTNRRGGRGRGRGRGRGSKFFEFKSRGGGRSMTFK